jgi:hypothetical protein
MGGASASDSLFWVLALTIADHTSMFALCACAFVYVSAGAYMGLPPKQLLRNYFLVDRFRFATGYIHKHCRFHSA